MHDDGNANTLLRRIIYTRNKFAFNNAFPAATCIINAILIANEEKDAAVSLRKGKDL